MLTRNRQARPVQSRTPANPHEWQKIMLQLMDRLQRLGIRHDAIREAYVRGDSEQVLRRMSILSQADIDREYPDRT